MKVLVSGQAELAVLIEGSEISLLRYGSAERIPCSRRDIPYLLGDATDVVELNGVDDRQANAALDLAWRKDNALHMALMLLNGEADAEARLIAAEALEQFLDDAEVVEFVCNRLYWSPLPDSSDLLGGLIRAEGKHCDRVRTLLEELGADQAEIRRVHEAWEAIPISVFGEPELKQVFCYQAITSGAFRRFAKADDDEKELALIEILELPRFKRIPNHRSILMSWSMPLRPEKTVLQPEPETVDEMDRAARPPAVREVAEKPRRSFEVFEAVNRQKDAVKSLLSKGDVDRALRYVDDLIQYQEKRSEAKDLARSLCDLAKHAKDIEAHPVQLHFAQLAVKVSSSDGWSQAQLGDAYFCVGRHKEALKSYDAAAKFGQERVARNGRAEVLKAMGRLDDALQEYDTAVQQFPDDAIARNGRAEVLKAMGRLDDALQEYDATVQQFPYDAIARNGRAEVLKAMGRLEDALQEYDTTVQQFSDDAVTRNGRAEVLKAMGRFDDALQEYDTAVQRFPDDAFARNGRAEVLKAMGRLDDALQEYDTTVQQFPHNRVAHTGRAEVLKAMGRLDDALQEYDTTVQQFPYDAVTRNGRAEVLKAMGRLDDALQEYDTTVQQFPHSTFARTGKASTLTMLARYEEALALLPSGAPRLLDDWVGFHVRGMILMKQGGLEAAIRTFEQGVRENPWFADVPYFRSALAVVRLRRNEFQEATDALADQTGAVCEVLRMHAFGGLGQGTKAQASLEELREVRNPLLVPLRDALAARYALAHGDETGKSDDWIFDQECALLLTGAVAGQLLEAR